MKYLIPILTFIAFPAFADMVKVSWTQPERTDEVKVYWIDANGVTGEVVVPAPDNQLNRDFPFGSYTLAAQACNTYGCSASSNTVTFDIVDSTDPTPLPPPDPIDLLPGQVIITIDCANCVVR